MGCYTTEFLIIASLGKNNIGRPWRWSTKCCICLPLARSPDADNMSPPGKWVIGFPDLRECLREGYFQRKRSFAIEIHGCSRKCSFLFPVFNKWDVSPTTALTDLHVLQLDVCLSRNKLHLHPDIETHRSHLHLPLQKPSTAQSTSREEDLPCDSLLPWPKPMEAFSWLSLF